MATRTRHTLKGRKLARPLVEVDGDGSVTVRPRRKKLFIDRVSPKAPAKLIGRRAKPAYQSLVAEAVHSAMSDLHASGLVSKKTMREFDAECLVPPAMSPTKIKRLRRKLGLSQTVLAAYLNTTTSTVVQWESGAKQPGGMGLKLLHIAEKKGLAGLEM